MEVWPNMQFACREKRHAVNMQRKNASNTTVKKHAIVSFQLFSISPISVVFCIISFIIIEKISSWKIVLKLVSKFILSSIKMQIDIQLAKWNNCMINFCLERPQQPYWQHCNLQLPQKSKDQWISLNTFLALFNS